MALTRRSAGIVAASVIGIAAVVLPILISVHFARKEAIDNEFTQLRSYAHDLLRRSNGTGDQSIEAFHRLREDALQPCSAPEIELMRQIAVTSSYLQAVGRTSKGQLLCSSLGTNRPIPLGPVTYVSSSGETIRLDARLPITGGQSVIVLEEEGFASIISPMLPLDTMTDSPDVVLGSFSPARHALITHRGPIDSRWLDRGSNSDSEFLERGMLVVILRSRRYDVAVISAAPITGVRQKMRQALLLFVPVGLVCGVTLACAVLYLARIRLSMPAELRRAARRNEFFLEYQPVVDLNSRQWIGAEALVRWQRGSETVRPDVFIPVAEESGIITLITERVLACVAADLPAMLRRNPNFRVSVNLSAADLQSPRTCDALKKLLAVSSASPGNLMLEVTERGFLQGAAVRKMVENIRALGIEVAIDDFGTGYSSLSSLETLNLSYLKIDKSFVETIGTNGATSQVVLHIVEMAHSLDLQMIAEGVDTEARARYLADRGVRFGQGWLFGKAMKVEDILSHLELKRQAGLGAQARREQRTIRKIH